MTMEWKKTAAADDKKKACKSTQHAMSWMDGPLSQKMFILP